MEVVRAWVWVVVWACVVPPTTPISYNIRVGLKLNTMNLGETPVHSHCKCRSRCWTLPACLSWSSFVSSGDQLMCGLADSLPVDGDTQTDKTAVMGYDATAASTASDDQTTTEAEDGTNTITTADANIPTTTNPQTTTPSATPPSATTTTTPTLATTPTPTTTTIPTTTTTSSAFSELDSKIQKDDNFKCDGDRGVTGIILKDGENSKDDVEYIKCSHPHPKNDFDIIDASVTNVSMGPSPPTSQCPQNKVITQIIGYKCNTTSLGYNDEDKSLDNSAYMFAKCQQLQNWEVDSDDCQEVVLQSVSAGQWPGEDDSDSDNWDNWLHCPLGYMAVRISRVDYEEGSNDPWHQVKTMKCCRIRPAPPGM